MSNTIRKLVLATAVGFAFAATPALAVPIFPGGLSIGDKTFDAFTCSVASFGLASPSSDAACSSIQGSVSETGGTAFLRLSSNFSADAPPAGSSSDTLITYHAHSASGIDLIDLAFDGRIFGLAATSVTETVHSGSLNGPVVGSLLVLCNVGVCDQRDPPLELGDIQLAGVFHDLYITKDIRANAALPVGSAVTSIIEQSFHQVQVPEPASLALLGTALVGLGLIRRRRRDQRHVA